MEQRRMETESWRCIACKNKTSSDRCDHRKKLGYDFCGTHIKTNNIRLWSPYFQIPPSEQIGISKIQALWKGYFERKLNKLRGVGLLKRNICMNDSELVSGDEKEKFDPFYYFSFEESGIIYWFDIRSIFNWTFGKLSPTNPYTRNEIKLEDMKRLRTLLNIFKRFYGIKIVSNRLSEIDFSEKSFNLSLDLVRRFRESGFDKFGAGWFIELSSSNRRILIKYIEDAVLSLSETDKKVIKLDVSQEIIHSIMTKYKWHMMDYEQSNFRLAEIILKLLDFTNSSEQEYFLMLIIIQGLGLVCNECYDIYY